MQELYHHKKPRKLLDQVRDVMQVKHYAFRTERTYIGWIKRFILFHDKKHPYSCTAPGRARREKSSWWSWTEI